MLPFPSHSLRNKMVTNVPDSEDLLYLTHMWYLRLIVLKSGQFREPRRKCHIPCPKLGCRGFQNNMLVSKQGEKILFKHWKNAVKYQIAGISIIQLKTQLLPSQTPTWTCVTHQRPEVSRVCHGPCPAPSPQAPPWALWWQRTPYRGHVSPQVDLPCLEIHTQGKMCPLANWKIIRQYGPVFKIGKVPLLIHLSTSTYWESTLYKEHAGNGKVS